MKFKKFLFTALMLFSFTAVFAGKSYEITLKDESFTGTYIPVQYEYKLKETRLFYSAMYSNRKCYDILLLTPNVCYSNLGFNDGYAVDADKFNDFCMVTSNNGKFIIDENGFSYRKISDKSYDDGGYQAYEEYVLSIIFRQAKALKNISINENIVTIDGIDYRPTLNALFLSTDNVAIWLRSKNGLFALCIDGLKATLYDAEESKEEYGYNPGKNVIAEFPLFLYPEEEMPFISPWIYSKEDAALIRNLVYAKNGAPFKDENLRKIFGNFEWYKENPAFTESSIPNAEMDLVSRCISREGAE